MKSNLLLSNKKLLLLLSLCLLIPMEKSLAKRAHQRSQAKKVKITQVFEFQNGFLMLCSDEGENIVVTGKTSLGQKVARAIRALKDAEIDSFAVEVFGGDAPDDVLSSMMSTVSPHAHFIEAESVVLFRR